MWNLGTCRLDDCGPADLIHRATAREPSKWQTHKDLSTDARHRGGLVCSSDEASVTGVERRDQIVQLMN